MSKLKKALQKVATRGEKKSSTKVKQVATDGTTVTMNVIDGPYTVSTEGTLVYDSQAATESINDVATLPGYQFLQPEAE